MRDLRIDSLKGFLILCVVWGHLGVLTTAVPQADTTLWQKFEIYVSSGLAVNYFHMALFFALSVIFIKPFTVGFFKKRFLLLLIPYTFWFLWPVRYTFYLSPIDTFTNLFYGNWAHVVSILWFLPACFTLNIYFSLYRKYANTIWAAVFWLLWAAVFLLAEPIAATYHTKIPFGIDLAIYLFPLLWLIDKIYYYRAWVMSRSRWWLIPVALIYYGSLRLIDTIEPVKMYSAYAARIDLAQFSVPFTVLGFIGFLLLCSSILVAFLLIKPLPWLAVFGKYSLPIYLLHLLIFSNIVRVYGMLTWLSDPKFFFVAVLATFPIIVFMCILISKVFSKLSPYAKYIGMVE